MIKREISNKLEALSKTQKVILITGARQVGKSTLVKQLKEDDREYITLDDLAQRELANRDPRLFLMSHPGKIIIDEIQYAPQLFSFIKMDVDNSDEKGKYWLTGSQRFSLMKGVSESLAGRVSVLEMSSLSFAEKRGVATEAFDPSNLKSGKIPYRPDSIFKEIFRGGMPQLIAENLDKNQFFNDYIATYLERDVRDLTQVGNLLSFRQFLVSVAARNGEVLNYSSICDDAGIDIKTAKNWMSILEASDIVYLLQPYFSSGLKRTTKAPKIVFMDTGLCSYLCGWSDYKTLEKSSVAGHYLETFIISELIKNKRNNKNAQNWQLYFYRDRDGKELDLIISLNGKLYPFEIKKAANPGAEMLKNFWVLENTNLNLGEGGIVCFYPQIIPLDDTHKSYPISAFL